MDEIKILKVNTLVPVYIEYKIEDRTEKQYALLDLGNEMAFDGTGKLLDGAFGEAVLGVIRNIKNQAKPIIPQEVIKQIKLKQAEKEKYVRSLTTER